MRRRAFLASGCLASAALAGCSALQVPLATEPSHPMAHMTVPVRIEDASESPHDLPQLAADALDFWREHAPEYAGFEFDFELVEEEARLQIVYGDSSAPCAHVEGYSERVLGCAPVISVGQELPRLVTAQVVGAARPPGKIRITTKHEIGHILGLRHEDEPRHIMSNRPEDRIPMFHLRVDIWEGVLTASETAFEGSALASVGIEAWEERKFELAAGTLSSAAEAYTEARGHVEEAAGKTAGFEDRVDVETVDLEALDEYLDRLSERLRLAGVFAEHLAAASEDMTKEGFGNVSQHITEANLARETLQEVPPVEMRDIAMALGLVRGFDREEEVVEVEDVELE